MSDPRVCEICGASKNVLAYGCKRCNKFIHRIDIRRNVNVDKKARVRALKEAWDGEGFRCYYTGVRIIEDNPHDPRYLTFDHLTPRQEDKVVVAAAVLNDMKSDMTEDEFKAMVIQLASQFTGGTFDESVFNLKHWKR